MLPPGRLAFHARSSPPNPRLPTLWAPPPPAPQMTFHLEDWEDGQDGSEGEKDMSAHGTPPAAAKV